jgi:hypothetical protein
METERLSLHASSAKGTWTEGFFTGSPEGYVKEGSGNGYLSPQGLLGGGFTYRGLRYTVEERSVEERLSL